MSQSQPKIRRDWSSPGRSVDWDLLVWPLACALLVAPVPRAARQSEDAPKRPKNHTLGWNPPRLDSPVRSLASSPPCQLSSVLELAGARSTALVNNLQKFTAQEEIKYETLDRDDEKHGAGSESFEYVVGFGPPEQGLKVLEYRKPIHGSSGDTAGLDIGLPELALIFLPEMQGDYDMTCEGQAEGQTAPAWVVRFQQRKDKPMRTFSFRTGKAVLPAGLKGRAWIDAGTGEIVHMETALLEGVAAVNLRNWYLSIDYGPVQFQSRPLRVWLPQTVDGYFDFGVNHMIVYHTFSDFLLFSIQTEEKIGKPKAP